MLALLRRKAQSPYIQAAVVAIIVVFMFWGVGVNQGPSRNDVATVNDEPITYADYQQTYEQTLDQFRKRFGGSIPEGVKEQLNLKRQVLNRLVHKALLQQGGKKSGLHISNLEIQTTIRNMAAFQAGGSFDRGRYEEVLKNAGLTPTKFEDSLRSDILTNKVADYVKNFGDLSPLQFKNYVNYFLSERQINYAVFKGEDFTDQVEIRKEKLKEYFQNNENNYKTDPGIKLQYLYFSEEDANGSIEEEMGQEKKDTGTFARANKAYNNIIKAGSLEAYARKNDIDPEETDFFSKNNAPEPISGNPSALDKIFQLKEGELSSIIEGGGGYFIIYVKDRRKPRIPELAEVREEVVKDMKRDLARDLAGEKAEKMLGQVRRQNGGLEKAAKSIPGATVSSSAFFSLDNDKAELPGRVTSTAFTLTEKEPYPQEVVNSGDSFYVIHLNEIREPDADRIEGAKEELREKLVQEKQNRLINAWLSYLKQESEVRVNRERLNL